MEYGDVFKGDIGVVKNFVADIELTEKAQRKQYKAQLVPFMLQDQIASELKCLESIRIIEKVCSIKEQLTWAEPIVVVRKAEGRITICADFKIKLNC